MNKQPKKKAPRKARTVDRADAKVKDFEAMTVAQLGKSLRHSVISAKPSK